MAPVKITDDYYAVLQVSATATTKEIETSFKKLALERHPDHNGGTAESTAAFQLLNSAHETLKDPKLRKEYDRDHGFLPSGKEQHPNSENGRREHDRRENDRRENDRRDVVEYDYRSRQEDACRSRLQVLRSQRDEVRAQRQACLMEIAGLRFQIWEIEEEAAEDKRWTRTWRSWIKSSQKKQGRERARIERVTAIRNAEEKLHEASRRLEVWQVRVKENKNEIRLVEGVKGAWRSMR